MIEARRFRRACVASPHHLASAAGLAVLADGGNALDAAVATNLALAVVASYNCGLGGDLFAMVFRDGVHAYNGSGRSGSRATLDEVREIPRFGPRTVTVPGAVEAWFVLLDRFGTRSFAELARPAVRLARDGHVLSERSAAIVRVFQDVYTEPWAASWREVYGGAGAGRRLLQPGIARTLEELGRRGPDAFYRGPIAEDIAAVPDLLLTTEDLDAHRGDWVEPLRTTYRGLEVLEMPPNSQGLVALEALNILEGLDLGPPESADRHHLLIEATKLGLADREAHVTDPSHMEADPGWLASKEHADDRRPLVDPAAAGSPPPGRPTRGGTVYLCAADADGMCVSLIQSNYTGFGSGVTVPGWGINLQNRGSDFSLDPSHANVLAPGKRTMHTLMPALVLRDGSPWLVFGTMGGDGQAQTHVQVMTRVVDDGMDVQRAIDAPRWVVDVDNWQVRTESRFGDQVVDGLRARGHEVTASAAYDIAMGHAHAILCTGDDYAAATDPRAEGAALGL